MNVYRVDYQEDFVGTSVEWHGNKRDAEKAARAYNKRYPIADAQVCAVYVPRTKRALLSWLNLNITTDNG